MFILFFIYVYIVSIYVLFLGISPKKLKVGDITQLAEGVAEGE